MDLDDNSLRRFKILGRIAAWDPGLETAAARWLDNFDDSDRPAAKDLLDAFVYVDATSIDTMFRAAFGSLAPIICSAGNYAGATVEWQQFLRSVLVTFPTGMYPNPSDSGYLFERKARQIMELDESQLVEPSTAICQLQQNGGPIVFVDDIIGSGQQFLDTWRRPYSLGGSEHAFEDIASGIDVYFVPLFCTREGAERILAEVPDLILMPLHWLDGRYRANDPNSLVWSNVAYSEGVRVVEDYSRRVGINNPWGHGDLGLCLGFAHAIPDLTVPLFYCEEDDWSPLVRIR